MNPAEHIAAHPSWPTLDWISHAGTEPPVFEIDSNRPSGALLALWSTSGRTVVPSGYDWEKRCDGTGTHFRISCAVPAAAWRIVGAAERVFFRVTREGAGGDVPADAWDCSETTPFVHGFVADGPSEIGRLYALSEEIPHLPGLRVKGNRLVQTDTGETVVLRGVNLSGMNYRRFFWGPPFAAGSPQETADGSMHWHTAAGITEALMDRLAAMGVKIVRVVLNQEWVVHDYAVPGLPFRKKAHEYLDDLDRVVRMAAARGMYVMLSLHTLRLVMPEEAGPLQASSGGPAWPPADASELPAAALQELEAQRQPYNAPMPDGLSWLFWSILAARYRSVPAVLFDICNEPHRPDPSLDPMAGQYDGVRPDRHPWLPPLVRERQLDRWWLALWKQKAAELEELIHLIHPVAVLFVAGFGGPTWSASLRGMPIERDGALLLNVVYKAHFYYMRTPRPRLPGIAWMDQSTEERLRYWLNLPADLFAFFVGEWGMESREAVMRGARSHDKDPEGLAPRGAEEDIHEKAWREYWAPRLPRTSDGAPDLSGVPAAPELARWAAQLLSLLESLSREDADGRWGGCAGWTAWSAFDRPSIFRMHGSGSMGVPPALTDFGEVFAGALRATNRPVTRA